MRYQLAKRGKSLSTIFLIMNTGGQSRLRPARRIMPRTKKRGDGSALLPRR